MATGDKRVRPAVWLDGSGRPRQALGGPARGRQRAQDPILSRSLDLRQTVRTGVYNISVRAFGFTTNMLTFTVADPTPQITGTNPAQPSVLPGADTYVELYGTNFGSNVGTPAICTTGANPCSGTPGVSAQVTYWSPNGTQVNLHLTALSTASAGSYDLRLGAASGSTGQPFPASSKWTVERSKQRCTGPSHCAGSTDH